MRLQIFTPIVEIGISLRRLDQLAMWCTALVTAGQNLDRMVSDAALARLCGVAPCPVRPNTWVGSHEPWCVAQKMTDARPTEA